MGLCNVGPQLCTFAILWTFKLVVEMQTKKSCEYAVAYLQNWTPTLLKLSSSVKKVFIFCYFNGLLFICIDLFIYLVVLYLPVVVIYLFI